MSSEAPEAAVRRARTLDLPYPPSTNHLYRSVFTNDGKVIRAKSAEAKRYEADVHAAMLAAGAARWRFVWPMRVTVELLVPNRVRRDVDNIKVLLDALCGGLGRDDSAITDLVVRRRLRPKLLAARVTIEQLTPQEVA